MQIDDIRKIAVIGAGAMGNGIAQLGIMAGYDVCMRDIKQEYLDKGTQSINASLDKLVAKGKISKEARAAALNRLTTTTATAEAVSDADFVIEAVPEIMKLKQDVFTEVDGLVLPHTILATNTSNMSISEIADSTKRPAKVIGMHFFNPAVLMKLVEVIRGTATSDETLQITADLALRMKKVPVTVRKDSPGFIYNRINAPTGLLLAKILEQGTPGPEEFDAVFKPFMPMAPFELMDYVGVDIAYHSQEYFARTLSPDYSPGRKFKEMVADNRLGKKTGHGFYDWTEGRPQIDTSKTTADFDLNDMIALQVNEATKLLEEHVVDDPKEIDLAMANGGGGIGPFTLAQNIGYNVLCERCDRLSEKFHVDVFRPTRTMKSGNITI